MLVRRFAEQFDSLVNGGYFSVPKGRLDKIHYSKLSQPAKNNIYILKQFQDETLLGHFEEDLTEHQKYYRENGYLILRNFIPEDLIDAYLDLRERLDMGQQQFSDSTPYMEHPEILNIAAYKPLMDIIRELHAAEMGLIFTLTGFKSTQRGWHQDSYLDADDAVPRLASWIACGDVTEECGPFEYIPGSHRWMSLANAKINEFLKPEYRWPEGHRARQAGVPGWGRICEAFIDPSVYNKMEADGAKSEEFTAKKGDVLLWYGRLMHRGSPPLKKGATRMGLIGHYAPIFERDRGYFAKHRETGVHYIVPPHKAHLR